MKKYLLLTILFLLTKPPDCFAQTIQTDNARAESFVETNIQGNGNVQTHIEVEANGEKKVLDANGPGTYKLEVTSNANSYAPPTVSVSQSPTSTPTPTIIHEKEDQPRNIISIFKSSIESFFERIKNLFKFW